MTKSHGGKFPLQASGAGRQKIRNDGVGTVNAHGREDGGESQGGSYPNPHEGKQAKSSIDGFMGHGGQSQIAYHGTGQLGEMNVEGKDNDNSTTRHN